MEAHVLKEFIGERFAEVFGGVVEPYLPRSQFRDEEGVVTTVKPTVIIGLGGSGTKAVARLKWRLQEFYRGPELESERRSIAFLLMDTLSYDNLRKEDPDAARFIYRVVSRDDYVYLGGFNPGQYLQAQRPLSRDLQIWWDERYAPPQVVIEEGAKRVRQLGRLALYRNKEVVRTSIRNAINSVVTIHASLVEQGRVKGLGPEAGNVYFYIFSGTCGGTGSGLVLDVAYLCYTLAVEQGRTPVIRLVLFMPRLFIEAARRRPGGEWLARAYEANAYAFFKELQHLVEAGEAIYRWRLDAREREGMDQPPYPGWRPNRIYLIDTEIAGKEIGEFGQLYTLAADYIFHAMVTPVGFVLEGARGTNIDEALGSRSGGRPNAFSSVGISYIVYPSKTITRSLSCRLLKETLDHLGRAPLTEEEKRSIPAKAQDLYSSLGDFLNPSRVDEKLLVGVENFVRAVPDGDQLLQRMEREGVKASELLRRAEDIGEEQEIMGKGRVDQNWEAFKDEALQEVRRRLREAVQGLIPQGFEVVKGVLSHLREQVEAEKAAHRPESPFKAEREAKEVIQRVEALERKWFVWRRRRKIEEGVRQAARKIREETDLTIRGYAAERRVSYLSEAVAVIEEVLERVRRAQGILASLRDEMEDRWRDPTLEYDETTVSVTTQFVPVAPSPEAFEGLYREAGVDVKAFAEELMVSPSLKGAIWDLGSTREDEVRGALETFFRGALGGCVERVGRRWLEKRVTDVIQEKWGGDPGRFRETYGQNLLHLADPCWALDPHVIPQGERRVTASDPACAYPKEGFPRDAYLPRDLQGEPFPGDPRMMVVLRSEHAAPLFAVRGVLIHREVYRNWLRRFQEWGEAPPHISRDWNRSEDALEDLERQVAVGTEEQEALAQGLFADWLVREKREPRLRAILAGKDPTGPVYVRGARGSYFYVVYERRPDGKLHKVGEVSLRTTKRYEAARAMDANAKKAVEFFMNAVDDVFSPADLRTLLDEYLDYLSKEKYKELSGLIPLGERDREARLRDMPDERQRALYRQLLQEWEILMRFKAELEGA
jgi:hypothetical protein